MYRVIRPAPLSPSGIGRAIFCVATVIMAPAAQAAPESRAADEAAIRAATKAYVEALDKGDAARLAALWTPDGDIVDASGQTLLGREAVALDQPATPPEPAARPEFRIGETRLRFLTPDVALEDGTVEVVPPAGQPLTGRFSATWVRHEGSWKLGALREARGEEPTAAAALSELEWMVGDWVVVDDHSTADKQPATEVSARWNDSKTYLIRELRIPVEGAAPLTITQRIGWYPRSCVITRSPGCKRSITRGPEGVATCVPGVKQAIPASMPVKLSVPMTLPSASRNSTVPEVRSLGSLMIR